MENALTLQKNTTSNLMCRFFGHKYVVTRNVTNHFKEYECCNCHKQMTNDPKGRRINLTQRQKEINETLVSLFQKRHSHTEMLMQNSLR